MSHGQVMQELFENLGMDLASEVSSYLSYNEILERISIEGVTDYWRKTLSKITSFGAEPIYIRDEDGYNLLAATHLLNGTLVFSETNYSLAAVIHLLVRWLSGEHKIERDCVNAPEDYKTRYTFVFDGVAISVNDDTLAIKHFPALQTDKRLDNYYDFIVMINKIIAICNLRLPLSKIDDIPYLDYLHALIFDYDVSMRQGDIIPAIIELMINLKTVDSPDGRVLFGDQIASYQLIDVGAISIDDYHKDQISLYKQIGEIKDLPKSLGEVGISYITDFFPLIIDENFWSNVDIIPDLEYVKLWDFDVKEAISEGSIDRNFLKSLFNRFSNGLGVTIMLTSRPETQTEVYELLKSIYPSNNVDNVEFVYTMPSEEYQLLYLNDI